MIHNLLIAALVIYAALLCFCVIGGLRNSPYDDDEPEYF